MLVENQLRLVPQMLMQFMLVQEYVGHWLPTIHLPLLLLDSVSLMAVNPSVHSLSLVVQEQFEIVTFGKNEVQGRFR